MKVLALLLLSLLLAVPGWAGVNFNGDADNVSASSNLSITTHPISVSLWVNLSGTSLQGCFFNIGDYNVSGPTGDGIGIGVGNGTFEYPLKTGNELILLYNNVRWIDTNDNIGTGWHNIIVTVNSSGYAGAYIDGANVYTEGSGTAPATNYDSYTIIGGYLGWAISGSYDRYVNAEISDVYVWNTVISASDIALLASSRVKGIGLQIKTANLKAYWPLDDHSSGTALGSLTFSDLSGNGYVLSDTDADGDSTTTAETAISYPPGAISQ